LGRVARLAPVWESDIADSLFLSTNDRGLSNFTFHQGDGLICLLNQIVHKCRAGNDHVFGFDKTYVGFVKQRVSDSTLVTHIPVDLGEGEGCRKLLRATPPKEFSRASKR
jgi:hypothetical protein